MRELEKCQGTCTQISVHAEKKPCLRALSQERERERASDIINMSMHSSDKSAENWQVLKNTERRFKT